MLSLLSLEVDELKYMSRLSSYSSLVNDSSVALCMYSIYKYLLARTQSPDTGIKCRASIVIIDDTAQALSPDSETSYARNVGPACCTNVEEIC